MRKFLLIIVILLNNCSSENDTIVNYNPPKLKESLVTDNYYGKEITDPYRNLENSKDSSNIRWYKSQTQYADNILDNISGRDALIDELYEISNRKSFKVSNVNITKNDQYFFLRKDVGDSYHNLFYKNNENSVSELIYDPKSFKPELNEDYIINYIKPSWNGNYVVISLSHSGRQLSELVIMDMKTRLLLPQVLDGAWPTNFLGINWLPDNSGFTYLYFPNTDISNPKFRRNSQSVLHLIKNENNIINYIFGNEVNKSLNISEKLFPTTKIHSNKEDYIIGYLAEVDNHWDAYYAKISDIKKGILNWKRLYTKADKIIRYNGYFKDDKFIFLTAKDAPNKRIMSVSGRTLDFKNAKEIISQKKEEVINDFALTKDAIYISTLKHGVKAKFYKYENKILSQVNTPKKAGKISLDNKSAYDNELWVSLKGWTSANERYKYNLETNSFVEDNLTQRVDFPEFKNITSEEVLVTSHDGKEVPLSIVYNKNIRRNGKNPVFIYGYGAYGDIESPYFSSIMLNFVAKGGVFCVAHVRGGGEKGESWYKDGFKAKKPNTWKDLIACTQYLIDEGFTSKIHTAIYGASAGAIMVGRAMTERPDLFKVVISQVGYLNPVRAESIGASGSNTAEYGTLTDSLETLSLINMDPYLHIKDSMDYPATYLTVGMNDPIVMPWMVGKFAARLQNRNPLKNPVLLNADFDAGHEGGSDKLKIFREWANIFSFILWQTGHPDYQLKQ